jgi:hypothetical protein
LQFALQNNTSIINDDHNKTELLHFKLKLIDLCFGRHYCEIAKQKIEEKYVKNFHQVKTPKTTTHHTK